MSAFPAGLLDTSVFIAGETGQPLAELPPRVAVSVVTIGELRLGVLAAPDGEARVRRAETLAFARSADPLPATEAVMDAWAELVNECRTAGIRSAVRQNDALIAATAIAHGLPVVTRDGDFDRIAAAHSRLTVAHV